VQLKDSAGDLPGGLAKIVEVMVIKKDGQPVQAKKPAAFRYYVSYLDMNRRMDHWVDQEHILRVLSEKEIQKGNLIHRGDQTVSSSSLAALQVQKSLPQNFLIDTS